jgi:hypothetical protein
MGMSVITKTPNSLTGFVMLAVLVFVAFLDTSRASEDVVLRQGTLVKLQLRDAISSETAQIGQDVEFIVTEDVKVGDVVVIKKGSQASGIVGEAMSGKLMGTARLSIYLGSVIAVTGLSIPVSGTCPAQPPALDHIGQDIQLPAGTLASATVRLDITVQP